MYDREAGVGAFSTLQLRVILVALVRVATRLSRQLQLNQVAGRETFWYGEWFVEWML